MVINPYFTPVHYTVHCTVHCTLYRSNTETLEHPVTHDVEIYARDEIPAGAQLTTSYVSAGLETNTRRQQLYDVWNFWCRCDTCRDNTECGSYRCVTTRPTGR